MRPSTSEFFERKFVDSIFRECKVRGLNSIWFSTDIFILMAGALANGMLFCLFLRERKSMSASQVLGLNLVVMDFLFLSIMPVRVYMYLNQHATLNNTDASDLTESLGEANDIFRIFNVVGCPLLLTCMCIEHYLAVIRPVLYLRARRWEYRVAVCAIVWVITLCSCLAVGVLQDLGVSLVVVSVVISCLFFVMLACLARIVWSLQQQSPAHNSNGNQSQSESPLKRKAVANVLAVVVPAVISYLPVVLLLPVILYLFYSADSGTMAMCNVFEVSLFFPRLGVLIAPLFYFSKARKMCCLSGHRKKI